MPEALHRDLARRAMKLFGTTTSERAKAYIYGTLQKVEKGGSSKVCPRCGGHNFDGATWCAYCGAPIAEVEASGLTVEHPR
jgi:uncharacterized OB-fold protein